MTALYSNCPPLFKTYPDGRKFDKATKTANEAIKSERDSLKKTEDISKLRIQALEKETKDLLASYQVIYEENRVLRSKIEHGPDAQRIRNFRNEIKRLEDKVSSLKSENELLTQELSSVQKDANQTSEDKRRIDDAFKMERGLYADKTKALEKETKSLEEKIERLERQQEEYERRVRNYDIESEGLIHRYKELECDKLKIETKYKKQKDIVDDKVRDTKETIMEMATEIIALKTKLAKVRSDYHSIKMDLEAAEKRIYYQNKEIEVYKTQSSLMNKNVKLTTHGSYSMKEELRSVGDVLNNAKDFDLKTVIEDRIFLRRRERKNIQRIKNLEVRSAELTREKNYLEKEVGECRQKIEAAILVKENTTFAETALKRRIEILENVNIDLDRQTKFMFDCKKKGLNFTMPDENIRNLEKEKAALFAKCRFLETQNMWYVRRIKEFENAEEIDNYNENSRRYPLKSRKHSDQVIHADLPSLFEMDQKSTYRRKMKNVRSVPSLQK